MDVEDFAAAQAAITAQFVREAFPAVERLRSARLTYGTWLEFLQYLFPLVLRARQRSSRLARTFYDEQREQHFPDLPRHDQFLGEYELPWLIEAMEPSRVEYSRPGASDYAVTQVLGRAMKEVENGGRRQILRAVDEDKPEGRRVRYARVATGRETCGFCWMLVSRGPVYESRESAGEGRKFHALCDCRVVPVFDANDWPGREAFKRAEQVWKRVTRGAKNNQDAMNRFRRAVEAGEVTARDFSIGAVA
jgi:hypothetical protein